MNIKQLREELTAEQRTIDSFLRRRAPKIIGTLAQNHYRANFRKGGFVDQQLQPWKTTKRQMRGGSAANRYGPLLSDRNHLQNSVAHETSDYRARIYNNLEYAAIHNYGGEITVTPKMRRYAWYRFFEEGGRPRAPQKGRTVNFKAVRFGKTAINDEAMVWKRLALTKKQKITIPQRRFIGPSAALNSAMNRKLAEELAKEIRKHK